LTFPWIIQGYNRERGSDPAAIPIKGRIFSCRRWHQIAVSSKSC
jgi:hypothetical protein